MKWDDLRVFLAMERAGALAGAASALALNPSTVWRRLGALDDAVGVALFEKTSTGYALSPAGEAIRDHARRIEEEVFAIERALQTVESEPVGIVRITAPESMLPLLSRHLVDFREARPGIHLELSFGDRMFDLDRREADVAIRPGKEPPASAVGRRVCAVGWTVYRNQYAAEDAPWVAYGPQLARLDAVQWRKRNAQRDSAEMTVSSVPSMACLLRNGPYQGMLPCFTGDAEPTLRRACPPIAEAASALWLLVHADLRRSARVRRFVDFIWERLKADAAHFEGHAPV